LVVGLIDPADDVFGRIAIVERIRETADVLGAERAPRRGRLRHDPAGGGHLDDAVISRVGDQGVPVGQTVRVPRPVELARPHHPGAVPLALAADAVGTRVLDDAVVLRIGDQDDGLARFGFEVRRPVLLVEDVVVVVLAGIVPRGAQRPEPVGDVVIS
jgi:hypothetical protein